MCLWVHMNTIITVGDIIPIKNVILSAINQSFIAYNTSITICYIYVKDTVACISMNPSVVFRYALFTSKTITKSLQQENHQIFQHIISNQELTLSHNNNCEKDEKKKMRNLGVRLRETIEYCMVNVIKCYRLGYKKRLFCSQKYEFCLVLTAFFI